MQGGLEGREWKTRKPPGRLSPGCKGGGIRGQPGVMAKEMESKDKSHSTTEEQQRLGERDEVR